MKLLMFFMFIVVSTQVYADASGMCSYWNSRFRIKAKKEFKINGDMTQAFTRSSEAREELNKRCQRICKSHKDYEDCNISSFRTQDFENKEQAQIKNSLVLEKLEILLEKNNLLAKKLASVEIKLGRQLSQLKLKTEEIAKLKKDNTDTISVVESLKVTHANALKACEDKTKNVILNEQRALNELDELKGRSEGFDNSSRQKIEKLYKKMIKYIEEEKSKALPQ